MTDLVVLAVVVTVTVVMAAAGYVMGGRVERKDTKGGKR